MVRSSRSFSWAVLTITLFSWCLTACSREPLPELISLTDALPREVEVGDRLEIVGVGLPEGRVARVTFRGDLNRPGEAAVHGAEIVVEGNVTASDRVEIPYTDDLEAQFCGAGSESIHTTFDGTIEVAFAATFVGAPPVAATLGHTSIDFRPPLRATSNAAAEADRLFAFAGIHVDDSQTRASGVSIASVDPGSRAEAAGLLDGDEIVSFNGVRVLSVADVAAIEAAPVARVGVRRSGGVSTTALLHLDGFRPAPTADRFAAVVLLIFVVGFLFVRFSPLSRWLLEVARRMHSNGASFARGAIAGWSVKYGALSSSLALCALLISVPCAVVFFGARADAPAVFGAVTLLGAFIALATRGVGDAARVVAHQLIATLSVAGVVVLSGSLRIDEIAATQGALPWSWVAFHGVAGLALFVGFVLALVASTLRPSKATDFASYLETQAAVPALDAADAVRLALSCSLAVPLFLGGGRLVPGGGHTLAFAIDLLKGGALFWVVAALRALVPFRLRLRELAPISALILMVSFAQVALHLDRRIETILHVATFAAAVLAIVHALWIARALGRSTATVTLRPSPFL
ncbi:MAG: PDZ domain-containing protein [Polyangiaceae bacterium]